MTTTLKTASFAFQKCFRCHLGFSTDSPPLLFESVSVALPCVRCTHTSEVPIWRLAYSIGCIRLKNWWKQIGWLSGILNSSQKNYPDGDLVVDASNWCRCSSQQESPLAKHGKIAEPLMLRSPSKTKSHRHMTPQIPGSTRQLFSWRARSQSLARNEAMIFRKFGEFPLLLR